MLRLPFDRSRWPFAALFASAAMLAAAHAFETFGHLAPCPLCLQQRDVYWAAMAIAAFGAAVALRMSSSRILTVVNVLLAVAFLTGAGVAAYHAGVEWKFFPAPPTCAAGAINLSGDLLSQLSRPQAVPSCADAAWRMFGISMAGYNVLASLVLSISSLASALRVRAPHPGAE